MEEEYLNKALMILTLICDTLFYSIGNYDNVNHYNKKRSFLLIECVGTRFFYKDGGFAWI